MGLEPGVVYMSNLQVPKSGQFTVDPAPPIPRSDGLSANCSHLPLKSQANEEIFTRREAGSRRNLQLPRVKYCEETLSQHKSYPGLGCPPPTSFFGPSRPGAVKNPILKIGSFLGFRSHPPPCSWRRNLYSPKTSRRRNIYPAQALFRPGGPLLPPSPAQWRRRNIYSPQAWRRRNDLSSASSCSGLVDPPPPVQHEMKTGPIRFGCPAIQVATRQFLRACSVRPSPPPLLHLSQPGVLWQAILCAQ